jgi:hypothetical protein
LDERMDVEAGAEAAAGTGEQDDAALVSPASAR